MIPAGSGLAVVLGMGPSGLFVSRQIARTGRAVAAIAREDDLGRHSKSIASGGCAVATSSKEVAEALAAFKDRFGHLNVVPSSDQYLTLLLRERNERLEAFGMETKEISNFRLINDKKELVKILHESMNIPTSCGLRNFGDEMLRYPCMLKWREKAIGRSSKAVPKAVIVRNRTEAEAMLEKVLAEGFSVDDFMLQELVHGDNSQQYSFGGYYEDGILLAGIAVNQIGQYPQGISACVVESDDEHAIEAKERSRLFAAKLKFSGFLEMEYKADERSGELFLLDANPRPWGWVSILGTKYPDFSSVFSGIAPEPIGERVCWKNPLRAPLCWRNPLNVKKSARACKVTYDILDAKDMGPLFALPLVAARKVARK